MIHYCCSAATEDSSPVDMAQAKSTTTISSEDQELLARYHHGFDDEKVDIDLIACLLFKLHSQQHEGIIAMHANLSNKRAVYGNSYDTGIVFFSYYVPFIH